MRRNVDFRSLDWADKTLSKIQSELISHMEPNLDELMTVALFEDDCTDDDAEALWRTSYDAEEHPRMQALHTLQALREQVAGQAVREGMMLSFGEEMLLERLLDSEGEITLQEERELAPALSLVRRMWCVLDWSEEGQYFLAMPHSMLAGQRLVRMTPNYQQVRGQVVRCLLTVIAALDTRGLLLWEDAASLLNYCLQEAGLVVDGWLCRRLLLASFDHLTAPDGLEVLVHPGAADPQALLPKLKSLDLKPYAVLSPEDQVPAMLLSDAERDALVALTGLIHGALRPECYLDAVVDDLHVLAKQQVPFEDMRAVLAAQLMVQPTHDMEAALRRVMATTPGWTLLPTRMVQ